MKAVVCSVPGQLREDTQAALTKHAVPHMSVFYAQIKPGDPFAYGNLIGSFWGAPEDFLIVEPDIVIREDVIDAFLHCECEYGCFPYAWLTDVGPALGCTWFRASFTARYPDAVKEVQRKGVAWNQFDVVLMRHILARQHGEQPHVHLPAVEHLNEAKRLLPEANPEPLMEVPHW